MGMKSGQGISVGLAVVIAAIITHFWAGAPEAASKVGPKTVTDVTIPPGVVSGMSGATGAIGAAVKELGSSIDQLTTKGRGPKTGYSREQFGPAWTDDNTAPLGHNGCDTRNDILRRDLDTPTFKPKTRNCVLLTGTLTKDPYTGKRIDWKRGPDSAAVQIDHIIPLSYAWQMGASRWTEEKRIRFANDPLNLLASDGPANMSKGDSGPASWLPSNKPYRCTYAQKFAAVAAAYNLPVTPADREVMRAQCD